MPKKFSTIHILCSSQKKDREIHIAGAGQTGQLTASSRVRRHGVWLVPVATVRLTLDALSNRAGRTDKRGCQAQACSAATWCKSPNAAPCDRQLAGAGI